MPSKQSIIGDEVHLSPRDLELGDVGQPLLVGRASAEVAVQNVLRSRTELAHVRAVSTTLGRGGNQALLPHEAAHDLLGDVHRSIAEGSMDAPVAIAAVVALEDVGHDLTNLGVLVARCDPSSVVEVRAARHVHFAE
jgi:hypothetical protein